MPTRTWAQARAELKALGHKAFEYRPTWTFTEIAAELGTNPAQICRALRAAGYDGTRPATVRSAKQLQDGRKAVAMLECGLTFDQVLQAIGGSRARLYRAINKATRDPEVDPMLL